MNQNRAQENKGHKQRRIGLLVSGMRGEWNISLSNGIKTAARETGTIVIQYCMGSLSKKQFNSYVYNIVSELVVPGFLDGLIINSNALNPGISEAENLAFLQRFSKIPIVTTCKGIGDYPFIQHDELNGMILGVKHFVEIHRFNRLAFICSRNNDKYNEYHKYFKKALDTFNLPDLLDYDLINLPGDKQNTVLLQIVRALVEKGIQGIILNKNFLKNSVDFLINRGIRIPGDISLIAFNAVSGLYMTVTPLTTVERCFNKLGYAALMKLLAIIKGNQVQAKSFLPFNLYIKRSCGCFSQTIREIIEINKIPPASETVDHENKYKNFLSHMHEKVSILAKIINRISDTDKKIEKLLIAYNACINDSDGNQFLNTLREILRTEPFIDQDLYLWHKVLTLLIKWTMPYLNNDKNLLRLQKIWQESRLLISKIFCFNVSLNIFESQSVYDASRAFAEKLTSTFNIEKQFDILIKGFPKLGIECAFLVLYENPGYYQYPQPPPEWSNLVLAYDRNMKMQLDQNIVRFKTRSLLPQVFLDCIDNHSKIHRQFIVEGLVYGLNQIGYAVFGISRPLSDVTFILRNTIGNALQGDLLYGQIQDQTSEIKELSRILEQENLKLSSELNIVGKLQKMILPEENTLKSESDYDIAVYMQPSYEVAGDYFDIIRKNQSVFIGLGDVTGHGLESGVIMVMLQTAIRTMIENGEKDLLKIYQVVNRVLFKNMKRIKTDKKLTVLITELNGNNVSLIGYHDEPFIVRNKGEVEVIRTAEMGTLVGAKQELRNSIRAAHYVLKSGDNIVLFTDGITEAMDNNKKIYTEERLQNIIRANGHKKAADIKKAVIRDLNNFIGDKKLYDDVSIIIIKVL